MTTIKLLNYTKKIKDKRILNDISMEFESGKIYKIEGYNGSGKTMLLRALAGLIYPTSGAITVDSVELSRDVAYPKRLGVLIENPLFWKHYRGIEVLKYLAKLNGLISEKEIREQMERMLLDPDDKRTIGKYSLGMRQKLGIIQAIMEKPDIILLDEPINGLDKVAIEAFEKIVKEEKERGALIVIAIHNDKNLKIEYDQVIALERGGVINEY